MCVCGRGGLEVCLSSLELSFSLITASLHQSTSSVTNTVNAVCDQREHTDRREHTHTDTHFKCKYSGNISHTEMLPEY